MKFWNRVASGVALALFAAVGTASATQYKATVQSAKDMRVIVQGRTLAAGKSLEVDGAAGIVVEGMTYGARRLYCIDPWKHANVGPNTTIDRHGPDGMAYTVDTGAYRGHGDWSILKENYGISPGTAQSADGKVAKIVPPKDGAAFSVSVTGTTEWKFVRTTPAGKTEKTESESGSATIRFEPSSGALPAGNWAKLVGAYEKAIPKGLTGNGNWNNLRSWFNKKYGDYACGAYQARVLEWLDGLKFSKDPRERAMLDGYDYGPIEAYWGGHQAVVVYPKGSNWVETGIVFDPWPNQKPETMAMAEWAQRFSLGSYHGIGGSSPYAGMANPGYPTVGGTYVDPAKLKPFTAAEKTKFKRLSAAQKARLKKIKDSGNRRYIARQMMEAMDSTGDRVMAHSPVFLTVVDSAGRRAGFPGGKPVLEIPGVKIRAYPLDDGTRWTEIEFPRAAGMRLSVEGSGGGKATILDGRGIGTNRPTVESYRIDSDAGQSGGLDLGTKGATLSWAGSGVEGRAVVSADDAVAAPSTPPVTTPSVTTTPPVVQPTFPGFSNPTTPPPAQVPQPAAPSNGGWAPITQ